MLELSSVGKSFGDTHAVRDVDLSIPEGSMIGVIGRSGAGKSTLLRLINRLSTPDRGEIAWRGRSVSALKGRELARWRARCGMVFQQFNLSPRLDVLTNVLVGGLGRAKGIGHLFKHFPRDERARAILELDALDMADAALKRADQLSGGQQQRVAIARTLMQAPEIILADEPIASLDPVNAETVMDALQTINRERAITVVVNLHALDIARRYCPRIVGMAKGRVVFDGPPEALTAAAVAEIYGRRTVQGSGPDPDAEAGLIAAQAAADADAARARLEAVA